MAQLFASHFDASVLLKYEEFDSILKSDLGKQKDETTGGEMKICECSILCVEMCRAMNAWTDSLRQAFFGGMFPGCLTFLSSLAAGIEWLTGWKDV